MSQATNLYISDISGQKFFRTVCSAEFKDPEIRNLEKHLAQAKKYPKMYNFLDIATARIFENGEPLLNDDELLQALTA